MRPNPSRHVILAITVAALSLVLGGCTTNRKPHALKTTHEQALAECARITTEVKSLPGVTDATCQANGYDSKTLMTPGIAVKATVKTESQAEAVAGRSTELAWLSNLQPLESIVIKVGTADVITHGGFYSLSETHDSEDDKELTNRFGPRPSPSIAP